MRKSGVQNGKFGVEKPQVIADRLARFLRALFPSDTAKRVSGVTGVPAATVSKWLEGSSAPSAGALLELFIAFGPDVLLALCPGLGWAEAIVRLTRSQALRDQLAALEREQSETFDRLRGFR